MLGHTAQRRNLEVGLSTMTIGLGVWITFPNVSMSTAAYEQLLWFASEALWGLMFMGVGLAQLTAVLINGMRWWTPLSRSLTCALSAVFYAVWAGGFWAVSPASTAVYTYAAMSALSAWCFYYAVHDAAEKLGPTHARADT